MTRKTNIPPVLTNSLCLVDEVADGINIIYVCSGVCSLDVTLDPVIRHDFLEANSVCLDLGHYEIIHAKYVKYWTDLYISGLAGGWVSPQHPRILVGLSIVLGILEECYSSLQA